MARFKTEGIDEIIEELIRMGEDTGPVADKMLMDAAAEVKECWRESALKHKHKDTGDLIESIGYPRQPKTVSGVRTIDIYPQGKDRKGVRNAEKAFVLHYGTSKRPGSRWVDYADDLAGPRVQAAMENVFNEFIEKGRVSNG
jgi:hypothetical protein